jgi:hypothetical protein
MKTAMHIENEQVQFNSFQVYSTLGDWDAKGTAGFDGSLHIDLYNKLTKETSGMLLSVQNTGKDFAKGLLKGTKFANAAASFVDNAGIPSDKEGRVSLKMKLGGTLSDPQASFSGFGEGEPKTATVSEPSSKKQVEQGVLEKKKELEENLQAQKAKAEQDANLKLAQEKAALESQTKQKEEQLKKDVVKKLKKFF